MIIKQEAHNLKITRKFEACGCDVSCQWAGRPFAAGSHWLPDPCTDCTCKIGEVECHLKDSPECLDPCWGNPCHNEGICESNPGYRNFSCTCLPGWRGQKCQYLSHSCPTHLSSAFSANGCPVGEASSANYMFDPISVTCRESTGCVTPSTSFSSLEDCERSCLSGVCCVMFANESFNQTSLEDAICQETNIGTCMGLEAAGSLTVVSFYPNTSALELPPLITIQEHCSCQPQSEGGEEGVLRVAASPSGGFTRRSSLRQDVRALSSRHLRELLRAFRSLFENGWIHNITHSYSSYIMSAHRPRAWLGVNRALIKGVETELQRVGGCHVVLPFWDFTTHALNLAGSEVWRKIPVDYFSSSGAGQQFGQSFFSRNLLANYSVGTIADVALALNHNDFEDMSSDLWNIFSKVLIGSGGTLASSESLLDPVFYLLASYFDKIWSLWQLDHPTSPDYASNVYLLPFNSTLDAVWHHGWACGTYEHHKWEGECQDPPEEVRPEHLTKVTDSLLRNLYRQPKELSTFLTTTTQSESDVIQNMTSSPADETKKRMNFWKALTWRREVTADLDVTTASSPIMEEKTITYRSPSTIKGLETLGLKTGWIGWWCSCDSPSVCPESLIDSILHQNLSIPVNATLNISAVPTVKMCGGCDIVWRHQEIEDPCWSSPCKNGGLCIPFKKRIRTHSSWWGYRCLCPYNFQGRHCSHKAIPNCYLTTDVGECPDGITREESQRWSYNPLEGNCAPFTYSGCGGNSNNHLNHSDCIDTCTRGTCCFRFPLQISVAELVAAREAKSKNTTTIDSVSGRTRIRGGQNQPDLDCLRPVRAGQHQRNIRNRLWRWHCGQTMKEVCVSKGDKAQAVTFTPGVIPVKSSVPPVCACRYLGENYKVGEVRSSSCHTCRCQQSGTFTCFRHQSPLVNRKEFRDMTRTEIETYQTAVRALSAKERKGKEDIQWHSLTDMYSRHLPHFAGTNLFLPWHRYLLWIVELALQDTGGCDLTIPYFDWTMDVGDLSGSAAWQANYFGGDGDEETACVEHHPFSSIDYPEWSPCLMRQFDNYVWLPDVVSIAHLLTSDDYATFRIRLEAMSGLFQLFVGGHALTPEKFYDPVFLSHMAFLDKLWNDWMSGNPAREESYLSYFEEIEIEPFGVTAKDVMKSNYLGVEYIPPTKGTPCLKESYEAENTSTSQKQDELISLNITTPQVDYDDYSSSGFDSQGYDRLGFNKDTFNRDGYNVAGLDMIGFDRYGFNAQGCTSYGQPYCRSTLNSTKPPSPVFDAFGYTKSGFNILGLDRRGYDVYGFDLDGFDESKCNYHSKGPFYKLLKVKVEEKLNSVSDESLFKNIERSCPPVTRTPDWWLNYNYFNEDDIEILRKQEDAASTLRPLIAPHRMEPDAIKSSESPYLPHQPENRLCLNTRPYSGCELGSPVVDCNEEEVCRHYNRVLNASYFTYNINGAVPIASADFSLYPPFNAGLIPLTDSSVNKSGEASLSFVPQVSKDPDASKASSDATSSLAQCFGRANIVCRALGCDGVCRPTFIDGVTGKEITCDGCLDETGIVREEGSTWSENCDVCTCRRHKITCSPITCPEVPCLHPVTPRGACCPDCAHGCNYNGAVVAEGDTTADENNPCGRCLCEGGSIVCSALKCPEFSCSNPVQKPGECCPTCSDCDGSSEGDSWKPDPCTHCSCKEGEKSCHSLECSPSPCHNPARPQGECCPVCHHCEYQGHHILNGDSKLVAPCLTCSCLAGTVTCSAEECPPPVCRAPQTVEGECCPVCPGQCSYDDRVFATDTTFQPSFNPCINCSCQDGRVSCISIECGDLPCPGAIVLPGRCCPDHCPHEVPCVDSKGRSRPQGDVWRQDEKGCQECKCDAGVVVCTGEKCQQCSSGVPVLGSCCPDCSRCLVDGQIINNWVWFNKGGDPCERCQCAEGEIKCSPRITCPEITNCSRQHRFSGACCPVCVGCVDDRGQTWENGDTWNPHYDPCQQCNCRNNLITCTRIQCEASCTHPVPPAPAACCPSCSACLYRSKVYAQGEKIPTTDPCSECFCTDGNLVCQTKECEPIYCRNARVLPGDCCPSCPQCDYEGNTYRDRSKWISPIDPCTTCQCKGGRVLCSDKKSSCNPQCPHPATPPGQCCPLCDNCQYLDQFYLNGMRFASPRHRDDCHYCICKNGHVECHKKACPQLTCDDPVKTEYSCCPACPVTSGTSTTPPPTVSQSSTATPEPVTFPLSSVFRLFSSPFSSSSSSVDTCPTCSQSTCFVEGRSYEANETFPHPENSCLQCMCLTTGVSCSQTPCERTPCTHPASPQDGCCHVCQDCLFTQRVFLNGSSFTHEDDPCQKCICQEGNVLCETIECPAQECSNPKVLEGVCCPVCLEPKTCLFLGRLYNYHQMFTHPEDSCQECSCMEGTVMCKDRPCPPYACPSPRQKDCCLDCNGCGYAGKTIENRAAFIDPLDPCRTCTCMDGKVSCYPITCPAANCLNPITPEDSCCPVCKECEYEEEVYLDGETFEAFYDPCTECRCNYPDVHCYPRVCPTALCTYPAPDDDGCCQKCRNCMFEGELFLNGQHFPDPRDPCAHCSCRMGEIQCSTIPCGRPRCPHPVPGECCPECSSGCQYEGAIIPDGGLFPSSMAECQQCTCHAGYVTCIPAQCPTFSCTHPAISGCCPHCNACLFQGREIEDGKAFSHPGKPCQECRCSSGSVTCSELQCPDAPCTHPRVVNCCPSCSVGCRYHGNLLEEGETVFSSTDRCHTCLCKKGSVKCARRKCPQLACPVEQQVEGECCPRCPTSHCMYEGRIYLHDARFTVPDSCQDCLCQEGRVECSVLLCPELSCPNQIKLNGTCCPKCDQSCTYNEIEYFPGQNFTPDDRPCEICKCQQGEVLCESMPCGLPNCTHPEPAADDACCPFLCKGCAFDGKIYENGHIFNHSCSSCHCQDGNITCSSLKCPELKCDVPIVVEGEECCATCPSCHHMGITLPPEYRFIDPDQPCKLCVCHNGEVTCFRESCPKIECQSGEILQKHHEEDCCPSCFQPIDNHTIDISPEDSSLTERISEAERYFEHLQKKEEKVLLGVQKLDGMNTTHHTAEEDHMYHISADGEEAKDALSTESHLKERVDLTKKKDPTYDDSTDSNIGEFHSKKALVVFEKNEALQLEKTSPVTKHPGAADILLSEDGDATDLAPKNSLVDPDPDLRGGDRELYISSSSDSLSNNVDGLSVDSPEFAQQIQDKIKNLTFDVQLPSLKEQLKFNVKIKVAKRPDDHETQTLKIQEKKVKKCSLAEQLNNTLSTELPLISQTSESPESPSTPRDTTVSSEVSHQSSPKNIVVPTTPTELKLINTMENTDAGDQRFSYFQRPTEVFAQRTTELTPSAEIEENLMLVDAKQADHEGASSAVALGSGEDMFTSTDELEDDEIYSPVTHDYPLIYPVSDSAELQSPITVVGSPLIDDVYPTTSIPEETNPDSIHSVNAQAHTTDYVINSETFVTSVSESKDQTYITTENPSLDTTLSESSTKLLVTNTGPEQRDDLDIQPTEAYMVFQKETNIVQDNAKVISTTSKYIEIPPPVNESSLALNALLQNTCNMEEVGKVIRMPDDPCTNCTCTNQYVWECTQEWCPSLDCPIEELLLPEGQCCPICRACEVVIAGELRQYGEEESWSDPDQPCTVCVCHDGRPECSASPCPEPPSIFNPVECESVTCRQLKCSAHQEKRQYPGVCCPVCAPASQRCVWWGRHLRTFDGLLLQNHARCAYTLVQHCTQALFTIYTKFEDSLRHPGVVIVTVVIDGIHVELKQTGEVNVNGVRESLPYVASNIAIYSHGLNVVVVTDKGLQVVWHVRGQVEVIVGGEHMGNTCGLCGNLNNHPQDDLNLPSGYQSESVGEFIESWSIGEKCVAPEPDPGCSASTASSQSYDSSYQSCSILKGPSFQNCHHVVPPEPYVQACTAEVCGCSEIHRTSCLCESLHLYATLCTRAGVILSWRSPYLCNVTCPLGMVWSECVPACGPVECQETLNSSGSTTSNSQEALSLELISSEDSIVEDYTSDQCPGPCVPGCTCPQGYAMRNAMCVPLKDCSP